jgi:hypothetical protein
MRYARWSCCGCIALLLLAVTALIAQEQGYRLGNRSVVIEGAEQWRAWSAPLGVREIVSDGTVLPRFLRAGTNAVANAGEFFRVDVEEDTLYGGISAAGSNIETAVHVIDGDPSSYWEPDPEDGLENWFVEIDLGRTVVARRIVVRFVDEGMGDPFLKFRVMVSDGRKAFGSDKRLQFLRVGQVNFRNKDQREFTFDVVPLSPAADGVEGAVTQLVRIDALASDGGRGAEVSAAEYEELDAEDRGAIDFFRVTVAGREISVLPDTYARLPATERGPVRYYRRERPRLAEIEVFELGDNIVSLTQSELFQDQTLFGNLLRRQLTDGLHSSSFDLKVYDPLKDENQLEIDLGAKYWLERVRLISPQNPPVAYQIRVADGSLDPSGELVWKAFDERFNPESFVQLEERFTPREVRYIELRRLQLIGASAEKATLSEVQAYGEGYVSDVVMTSPLIKLGSARIFSSVDWQGQMPPGTQLEVRTRSGDDLIEDTHYYDRYGREIGEDRWVNIRNPEHRGPVVVDELIGPKWSNWSEIYAASGSDFRSPNPRRMVQVQVRLRSSDPLRAASLRRMELNFSDPLVEQVLAEVWPVRGVEAGSMQEFTVYLQPNFASGDPGFDRLKLQASSSAPLELVAVRAGSEAELRFGSAQALWPGQWSLREEGPGFVALDLPQIVRTRPQIYAIAFRTRVFLNSTTFSVELSNSTLQGTVQRASDGEVSTLAESQSMVVVTDLVKAPLLDNLRVEPKVFSPNGDGINDEANMRFSVFRLEGQARFSVRVYDLSGRALRDLSFVRANASGEHSVSWDGRNAAGKRVAPGIYLLRVDFSSDVDGTLGFTTPVHVVY